MSPKTRKKIVVGMSGGVDSSMALVLLQKAGWSPIGLSLKYPVWEDCSNLLRENICCSEESFQIAKNVCQKLKVPHHVFDVSSEFKKEVIEYFLSELKENRTPNPCIVCNPNLKFKKLFEWAHHHGIEHVATGHYARIRRSWKGEWQLLKAKDREKDQTYSLSFLPQEWLSRIVFPLGDHTKQEIYKLAKKQGFEIFLKRKQSQDFCFVAGQSMESFLSKEIGIKEGEIRDEHGKTLGRHRGLHFYTIGQRKGMNLSGGPYFVTGKDTARNVLWVSREEGKLKGKEIFITPYHFISQAPPKKIRVQAKIRYRQQAASATLYPLEKDILRLVFDRPERAITPGQFAVFYQRNVCLGSGQIILQ